MKIYTIGFTKSSAKNFFDRIKNHNPNVVIDVRLNNTSQLAGFAKGDDLLYFIKEICGCEYVHDKMFAPSQELLECYKHKKIKWADYVIEFERQMEEKDIINYFLKSYGHYDSICLLCSEFLPNQCHRRLIAEKLLTKIKGEIFHL